MDTFRSTAEMLDAGWCPLTYQIEFDTLSVKLVDRVRTGITLDQIPDPEMVECAGYLLAAVRATDLPAEH